MTSNVAMCSYCGVMVPAHQPHYCVTQASGVRQPWAEELVRERDELRAENEQYRKWNEDLAEGLKNIAAENERLRAALAEMLESFTEPEDDNDILRRARAALDRYVWSVSAIKG